MFTRREMLKRTLKGSSLIALSPLVPGFLASTARAAEPGKDKVLVVIELNGGNDGLNTVIPHSDDVYRKARPTLAIKKDRVVKVTDDIGLHPSLQPFAQLLQNNQLAVVQGVGYPNPDRSHFESMDIWHLADPTRKRKDGWIGRSISQIQKGGIAAMQIGQRKMPLALQGGGGSVVSINDQQPYRLDLGTNDVNERKARRKLIDELAEAPGKPEGDSLLAFVQRRQLETYTSLDRLEEVLRQQGTQPQPRFRGVPDAGGGLTNQAALVARLIQSGFGTRVFFLSVSGFDTHSGQAEEHARVLGEVSNAIATLFQALQQNGDDKRTLVLTFSEFGRRVQENGSKGTDHGSGSSLFVAGPGVKGGLVGKHPSLTDLDAGDLKHHTDFRRVYATLLDKWLGCDSRTVLDGKYESLDFIKTA